MTTTEHINYKESKIQGQSRSSKINNHGTNNFGYMTTMPVPIIRGSFLVVLLSYCRAFTCAPPTRSLYKSGPIMRTYMAQLHCRRDHWLLI